MKYYNVKIICNIYYKATKPVSKYIHMNVHVLLDYNDSSYKIQITNNLFVFIKFFSLFVFLFISILN
jgi:hypothetical protein